MIYNLAHDLDRERFRTKALALLNKGAAVELTEKVARTPSQNRYLHLIIGVVAMETGNTLDFTKEWYFKRLANASLFVVERTDCLAGTISYLRSSSDLTREEMSLAIDRFKKWAAENGLYIPEPEDSSRLRDIEIEMGRMEVYL